MTKTLQLPNSVIDDDKINDWVRSQGDLDRSVKLLISAAIDSLGTVDIFTINNPAEEPNNSTDNDDLLEDIPGLTRDKTESDEASAELASVDNKASAKPAAKDNQSTSTDEKEKDDAHQNADNPTEQSNSTNDTNLNRPAMTDDNPGLNLSFLSNGGDL